MCGAMKSKLGGEKSCYPDAMSRSHNPFTLDDRLAADTFEIGTLSEISVRLMSDSRWPWIILVPQIPGLRDYDDIDPRLRHRLDEIAAGLSRALKADGLCQSTNIATLGNVVAQFHLHVVGRNPSDPGWPGPVWGFGECQPYDADEARKMIARLANHLTRIA